MRIDPHGHVPIFLQIVEGLRGDVARGIHKAGEPLPSVRELAVRLGVNPNTVQRALEALEREGLVESRRGKGMFVTGGGLASARMRSEASVNTSLEHAIQIGVSAGMSANELQRMFAEALDRIFTKVDQT